MEVNNRYIKKIVRIQAEITVAVIIAIAVFGLSGCGTTKKATLPSTYPDHYQEQPSIPSDHIDRSLVNAANKIERSLRILAELKNAETVKAKSAEDLAFIEWQSKTTPRGMAVPISFDNWTGPGIKLIRMIGGMTGYNVEPYGNPPVPVRNVVINSVNRPAVDVLRDASTQMNGYAKIRVIPTSMRIEIHYVR